MTNKPNRVRNHNLYVRLNDKEYNLFLKKQKSSGLSKQDYVIDAITNSKVTSSEYVEQLKELNSNVANYNRQISGMATNINQLAHKANATDLIDTYAIEEATDEIISAKKEGEKIWHSIRSLMATAPRMAP